MRYKHGWILFMLFAACLLFYYLGEILNIFKLDFLRTEIFYTVHDLHRLFFLVPIIYASYHFGIKGAVVSVTFIFLSLLPRAFFISPYPDPFLRMTAFMIVACIVGVFTARVTAILSANEARFRELFDNMGSGVAVYETHDDGNTFIFINFNKAGENIDHIKKENLIGRNVADVFLGVKEFGLFDVLQRVWRTGVPEHHPVSHYEEDRIYSWRNHYVYKLHTGEIVDVYDDVTDQKLAEKSLQKTREMLVESEKLAALGKLSAGAAHEILNPLNILSLRLQVLEMTETLSEKTKETIKIAKAQIDRIVKITHGISEFSRTKALYMTTVDLRELMEDVFSLTASRLKAENVTFDFQYQADIPSLSLDKFRIEQVILNLVSNAIDAMKDGKEKLLRVTAALDSSEEKKNVRISFSDNGTGIKAEDMKRIFEPFFTTKEPDKGKGLGLSVCYGILQDHKGKIWVENNEWGGATFFIELPVWGSAET